MSGVHRSPEYLAKLASKETAVDYPTADSLYKNITEWLTEQGCLDLVAPVLIESYCLNQRAYLECESMNRQLGRAAKSTSGIDLSPYVEAALKYGGLAQKALLEIQSIVTHNKTAKRKQEEAVRCWKL
jgi:phage terminase small subunit